MRGLIASAGVLVLAVGLGAPAVSRAASGNRHAISIQHQSNAAVAKRKGVRFTRTGWLYTDTVIYTGVGYNFIHEPFTGAVPASERVVMALSHGKILWEDDHVTPICPSGKPTTVACGQQQPFEAVVNRHGLFARFRGPNLPGHDRDHAWDCYIPHSRFRHRAFAPDGSFGDSWLGTFGNYAPVRRSGRNLILTSTQGHGPGEFTETDVINARTHLLLSSQTSTAATADVPAYSSNQTATRFLDKTPRAPHVEVCGP